MRPVLTMLLACMLPMALWAEDPRSSMQEGQRAFQEERFAEAAEAFRAAAAAVQPDDPLDPARAWYNRASALHEAGQFAEAAAAYQAALGARDLEVQQAAHFNRGNALLMHALDLAHAQQLDQAAEQSGQAIDSYRNALLLNPQDRAAKINLEMADQVRQQIEELLEQMPPQSQPQESPQQEEGEDEGEDEPSPETPDAAPEPPASEDDETAEPDDPAESETSLGAEEASEAPAEPAPDSMEEMSEEEAMLLLDAMRDEEQQTRDRMRLRLGEPEEVEKDW